MQIETTRFGRVEILEQDVLRFPTGLIGMEECRRWVLLADAENSALGWLQSTERSDLALAVVSPRRFVPDYVVRVAAREVSSLGLAQPGDAQVLVVVNKVDDGLAVNLKAPIVISVEGRCGKQIIAKDDHAVQYELGTTLPFRRSA